MMWVVWWFGCIGSLDRQETERPEDPNEGEDRPDRGGGAPVDEGPDPRPVEDGVACYLGADRSGGTCLDVVVVTTLPSAYDYPAPLSGSAQYVEPQRYLDLQAEAPSTRLAPNFRLDEVAQAFKGRFAVVQSHAIEHLQSMRDDLGALVINSGYRNPDYNRGVGGATWSRHMYGDAFDIDPVSVSLNELADSCERNGAGFVSVYETHVHCDWRDDRLDSSFFSAARTAALWTEQPELSAEILRDGDVLVAPAQGWDEGEPLREWTAYDADGEVVAKRTGRTFEWPTEAVEVEVDVGRVVKVRYVD